MKYVPYSSVPVRPRARTQWHHVKYEPTPRLISISIYFKMLLIILFFTLNRRGNSLTGDQYHVQELYKKIKKNYQTVFEKIAKK